MKEQAQRVAEGFLFTDQYQLTMAQLYYRMGMHERLAQFDYFFRKYPHYGAHQAGYAVFAGLEWLLDWMEATQCRAEDVAWLRRQKSQSGERLFGEDFLAWLGENGNFAGISLSAIPEGRVVHANVPLATVRGSLALAQILETSLLNHLNYPTLVATKAARIGESARGQLVMEFGLRRAQERGGNAGTRAALIGGAHFSSNVGISHLLGYPPKGTHAHSMVQVFVALGGSELDAFQAYADHYPNDCLLLVDTIDTLQSGVPNAIRVFEQLRRKGHKPLGIRLDSGDLAYLSIQAAKLLNNAGFPDTTIVLSNQMDELTVLQILTQIEQEAPRYGIDADHLVKRLTFGIGTNLITSEGSPALGGVYKLVAIEDGQEWKPAIKISESSEKIPNPGEKRVWRIYDQRGQATADLLTLTDEQPDQQPFLTLQHPSDHTQYRQLAKGQIAGIEPLLTPVWQNGHPIHPPISITELRARCQADLQRLDPGVRRIINPHIYHVSISEKLWQLKQSLIRSAKRNIEDFR